MPRSGRVLCESGIYHVILRGNERKDIFQFDEDKLHFLESIFLKKKEYEFILNAYCIMSNHVHLLINTNLNDLSLIMRGIGVRFATYYNNKYQRVGHVFQDRFKSEPIQNEQYLLAVTRYIHNNPVKARVVNKPDEYKWSSFRTYIGKPSVYMVEDTTSILNIFSPDDKKAKEEFIKFSLLKNDSEDSKILDVKEISTLKDGKAYLKEYLAKNWSDKELTDIHPAHHKEIIIDINQQTDLSIRKIAQLLNLNFNTVRRVISNKTSDESKEPSP